MSSDGHGSGACEGQGRYTRNAPVRVNRGVGGDTRAIDAYGRVAPSPVVAGRRHIDSRRAIAGMGGLYDGVRWRFKGSEWMNPMAFIHSDPLKTPPRAGPRAPPRARAP